ncbi:DNA double-strand break repair nuclease NurA [Caldivirga sp.]|uniref:DNA double-strand break repair nuclease NurA n=1 Tax=Caldivirga sp. TaxID=2080243 RepID=UPI0025BF21F0|nr:DNA double-strand break repair nuclease NurA [Caldivirga sp.]
MPDIFMDLLIKELNSVSSEVEGIENNLIGLDETVDPLWIKVNASSGFTKTVAVDGGLQEVKLSNGYSLSMARAIAVNNMGVEPIRTVKVSLFPESSPGGILTMGVLEVNAALRAINEYGGLRFVLMDGSLFAKILEALHIILLGRNIGEIYAIPEAVNLINATSRLINEAVKRGIKLLFISKDNSLRVYKEYLILRRLSESKVTQLRELASEGLNYYSVTWSRVLRARFFKLMKNLGGSKESQLISMLLNQSVSDSIILLSSLRRVNLNHGIVKPMIISGGLSPRLSRLTESDLDSLIERRLNESLIMRGIKPSLDSSTLINLPQVALTYVAVSPNDSPILVELPVMDGGFLQRPKIRDPTNVSELIEVSGLIISDYVDPVRYNGLLTLAHVYANFTVNQLSEYMAILQSKLGLRFSRRLGLTIL